MILRQKRFRPEKTDSFGSRGAGLAPPAHCGLCPNSEERYAAYERSTHLNTAICQLPVQLRSVVELAKTEGYSIKQIAQKMGISVRPPSLGWTRQGGSTQVNDLAGCAKLLLRSYVLGVECSADSISA